jgi:hypothetical protein
MTRLLKRAAFVWLPLAVALTGLSLAVYAAVQQDLRQSANDPQIQMAEDAATSLNAGAPPTTVVPPRQVDLKDSLQPFVMVFDNTGALLASSATLDGQAPDFPKSVLENLNGQDRITWQPEAGVRSAVIVQGWQGGFVVVGRSLRLVEEREQNTLALTAAAWAASVGAAGVAALAAAAFLV